MRIATLLGPRLEDLEAERLELDPECDAFEVRLDSLTEDVPPSRLRTLTAKPLIGTNRPRREGGGHAGPEEARLAALKACLEAGFEYIDVEGDLPIEAPEARLIRSRHELRGTPPDPAIASWCATRAAGGARPKFVAATASLHASVQVLAAARLLQRKGIAAAVTGLGEFPRALLPLFGVDTIYGGGAHRPPGQPRLAEINATLRHWGNPRSASNLFLVVGAPVMHSLSPRLHNAAFQATSTDAAFGALGVHRGSDLQILLEAGRRLALQGGSVTSPLKDAAYQLITARTPEAEAAAAVNCFRNKGDEYEGHNTDGLGARTVLARLLSGSSGRVLVLGAGGAGRAVAAGSRGFDVTLAARSPERLRAAARSLGVATMPLGEATARAPRFDVVVNATSVMEPIPVDGGTNALFDLHYDSVPTPWEEEARRASRPFAGGRELLLEQGLLAFEFWTGRPPPGDVMRAALEVAP